MLNCITFHNGNLIPEVVEYQKKVFDYFGFPLLQIKHDLTHGEAIDKYLNESDWDKVVIFDIDCIPLHKDVLKIIETALNFGRLVGNAQISSHIPGSTDFVAPSFIGLTKDIWLKTGKQSFKDVQGVSDVGEMFTWKAKEAGVKPFLLYPMKSDKKLWTLQNGLMYGYGTTFGFMNDEMTYHAFESNAKHHSSSRFIEKCKQVINETKH